MLNSGPIPIPRHTCYKFTHQISHDAIFSNNLVLFARLQLSLWSNFKFLLRIFRISSRNLHYEIVVSIQYFVLFQAHMSLLGALYENVHNVTRAAPRRSI